jgi:hypothetical protein
MKQHLSTLLVTTAIAATLSSCSSLSDLSGSMTGLAGGGGGVADAIEQAKASPVVNLMYLPPSPAVGQSWTMDMSGMKSTSSIVAEMDGQLIVEQETMSYGAPLIVAYQVDPRVDLARVAAVGEKATSNVTAAWIGEAGKAPVELTVMDAMVIEEMPDVVVPETETTTGSETVTLGGRSWNADWSETSGSKSWMVDGFLLRSDYNGDTMMQISDWKTDAQPALDWTPSAE